MTVTPVTSLAQFREIIESDTLSFFDFWATWCGPCRVVSPVFEKLSEQYPNVKFYKVDVDEQTDIAQECAIRAMPTFIAFQKGNKLETIVGAVPAALEAFLSNTAA